MVGLVIVEYELMRRKGKIMKSRDMTSKSTNFAEELNKSLTQEEKDILGPIIYEIKEENTRRKMNERTKAQFLKEDIEEYN